jgi:2,3-bisphosphoglycerate-independent phosphoglycerate mutase
MNKGRSKRESSESYVLIVLDGMGDLPHPVLNGKTPLEAAKTPNLDMLAGGGALGTLNPVRRGVAPESDAGVMGLLGYDPETESPGRGVLEAIGAGVDVRDGEVALRFNFATANDQGLIVDQRVGRGLTTEEAAALARSLTDANLLGQEGIEALVKATVGHRGVVRLKAVSGGPLSADISNSDPFYERVGRAGHALRPTNPYPVKVRALVENPAAQRTAEAVNLLSSRAIAVLETHPVNTSRRASSKLLANRLLLRDAGTRPTGMATFAKRHGIEGSAVTEMPVERGIAKILDLEDVFVGPMGQDIPRELGLRADLARKALSRRPFVYVHLKGPDEPGHDGLAEKKRDVIERLDKFFMGPFLDGLDLTKTRVAVTADHSTPCIRKGHTDDPVPLLVTGGKQYVPGKTPVKFSETSARNGTLGEMLGKQLVPFLLGHAQH